MLADKKTQKKIRNFSKKAEFVLSVACDVYVIVVLMAGALALNGLLMPTGLALKGLYVSLAFFGLVRVIVAVARGHRVVE